MTDAKLDGLIARVKAATGPAAPKRYKSSDFTVPAPRPEWTAEKESLLRMLGEVLAGHLFWREGAADRSNSHKLIKLKNAAFPEPQS